jgi:hypothetical protein
MKFARIVFGIAAAYGLIVLTPMYFLVGAVGRSAPPPVTHPEFYYGFVGVGLLWQLVFALIAKDPVRYRPVMLLAILEKFIYTIPVVILYQRGQAALSILEPSLVDPVFGVVFIVAYLRTPKQPHSSNI